MQITIINGGLREDARLQSSVKELSSELRKQDFTIEVFELDRLKVKDCLGCFSCLVRSPGICVINDDMQEILKSYVSSKIVIMASSVTVGFVTSCLKIATDRLLPLFHAHLTIHDGVFGHRLRYAKYPSLVLLLSFLNDSDKVFLEDITSSYSRVNLNYRKTIICEYPIKSIANEISNL